MELPASIRRLLVDHLHVVGDVYVEGQEVPQVMGMSSFISILLDIQWGNHDIIWMGSFGSKGMSTNCVARHDTVIYRISKKAYGFGIFVR